MNTHGGAREGAGRKPSEPTAVMRVPQILVEEFKKRIAEHKTQTVLKVKTKISAKNSPSYTEQELEDIRRVTFTDRLYIERKYNASYEAALEAGERGAKRGIVWRLVGQR